VLKALITFQLHSAKQKCNSVQTLTSGCLQLLRCEALVCSETTSEGLAKIGTSTVCVFRNLSKK